jgi:hypothetical protein
VGCLYALLGFDLLTWGGLAVLGFSGRETDAFWSLHAPFYAWLPAKVALSAFAAIGLLAAASRFSRLRPVVGPLGVAVGVVGFFALAPYLFFYGGGI